MTIDKRTGRSAVVHCSPVSLGITRFVADPPERARARPTRREIAYATPRPQVPQCRDAGSTNFFLLKVSRDLQGLYGVSVIARQFSRYGAMGVAIISGSRRPDDMRGLRLLRRPRDRTQKALLLFGSQRSGVDASGTAHPNTGRRVQPWHQPPDAALPLDGRIHC